MNNLARLGNYLKTDEYKEIYQNYFLNFDDNDEILKKSVKKNKNALGKKQT